MLFNMAETKNNIYACTMTIVLCYLPPGESSSNIRSSNVSGSPPDPEQKKLPLNSGVSSNSNASGTLGIDSGSLPQKADLYPDLGNDVGNNLEQNPESAKSATKRSGSPRLSRASQDQGMYRVSERAEREESGNQNGKEDYAVEIESGNFTWEPLMCLTPDCANLRNINFKAQSGTILEYYENCYTQYIFYSYCTCY